jgi:hypothetical protein
MRVANVNETRLAGRDRDHKNGEWPCGSPAKQPQWTLAEFPEFKNTSTASVLCVFGL